MPVIASITGGTCAMMLVTSLVSRLAPIPRNWEEAAPDRLELYCRAAQAVTRTTPIRGVQQPPTDEA